MLTFEILFGGHKPIFRHLFMKVNKEKEFPFLLGFLICQITAIAKKTFIIYTNAQKCDIINNFCKFYSIDNVLTYSGNGVMKREV